MENSILPLVVLAAVWGGFPPVLTAIKMMNERRDKILDPNSKLTVAHRKLMFYSDWITILVSTYAFLIFIGVLIWFGHEFVSDSVKHQPNARLIFRIVGAIFFSIAGVGMISGTFDFLTLYRHVKSLSSKANSNIKPIEETSSEANRVIEQLTTRESNMTVKQPGAPADPKLKAGVENAAADEATKTAKSKYWEKRWTTTRWVLYFIGFVLLTCAAIIVAAIRPTQVRDKHSLEFMGMVAISLVLSLGVTVYWWWETRKFECWLFESKELLPAERKEFEKRYFEANRAHARMLFASILAVFALVLLGK